MPRSVTAISGRAHLLGRAILRSPSLSDEEQMRMLKALVVIDTAVRDMVVLIDGIDLPALDGDAGLTETSHVSDEEGGVTTGYSSQ